VRWRNGGKKFVMPEREEAEQTDKGSEGGERGEGEGGDTPGGGM